MHKMTILYDATCGLCFQVKQWMLGRPKFLEVEFVAASSPAAFRQYPTLASKTPKELIVIGDDGAVYRDDAAWIMCMYALVEYRDLAIRFSSPMLRPLARRAWRFISSHRKGLSTALAFQSEQAIQAQLSSTADVGCAIGEGA